MCSVNRLWTALLLLAAVVVAGSVGYVLVHNDKVPAAGKTPGYTASAAGVPNRSGSVSGSSGPSGSAPVSGSGVVTTSTSPSGSAVHLAFLGDNWTSGAGVGHDKTKAFPGLVADALHVKVSVFASDGAGYAKKGPAGKSFLDLVDAVAAAKPTIVIVSGGRNDVSDDPNTLAADAKDLFHQLESKLPDAKLVAIAPFWGDSDHPGDLSKVDDAVKTGVESVGGTYLNLSDPLHNHADWMADAANPNAQGNQAIAEALEPELQKQL